MTYTRNHRGFAVDGSPRPFRTTAYVRLIQRIKAPLFVNLLVWHFVWPERLLIETVCHRSPVIELYKFCSYVDAKGIALTSCSPIFRVVFKLPNQEKKRIKPSVGFTVLDRKILSKTV